MLTNYVFATLNLAALPALRVISVIAVAVFVSLCAYIYRRRHQLFDRDPELAEYQDGHGVRHIRVELVLIVWTALTIVLLGLLFEIWSA
jgi:hypothetical protein